MTVETPEAPDLAADDLYADSDSGEEGLPDGEAPFGYTRDRVTGELRPKKRPGRPKTPPGPEQLAAGEPVHPAEDHKPPPPKPHEVPMPRGGVIAKGVDKLYRRAGKLLRVADPDIGQALIDCTHAEDPDELTVGQAWEAVAKENPRIRAFLLRLIRGGAWSDLLMAHLPIGIAIMSKPWIQDHIPWHRVAESMLEEDEDTQPNDLRPADAMQLKDMAERAAGMAAAKFGNSENIRRLAAKLADGSAGPEDLEHLDPNLVAAAQRAAASGAIPLGLRRAQPRTRTRAQRKHK